MHKTEFQKFIISNNLITDESQVINSDKLESWINSNNASKKMVYLGIDPTKDTLHIGHLSQLVMLKKLEKYFQIAIVIGTSTARIGDPSGKKVERKIVKQEQIVKNSEKIINFLKKLKFFKNCLILQNHEWIPRINLVDFLSKFCKYINVSELLNKKTVKTRLEGGLSVAEFLYSIVQGIDFWYLNKHYNCVGQIGGSDQKGNIINGIGLIKALDNQTDQEQQDLFGITTQLIVDNKGRKIGKSGKNSIPIIENNCIISELFNFLYNTDDKLIRQRFQLLTDCDPDKINKLEKLSESCLKSEKFLQIELNRKVFASLSASNTFELNVFFSRTIFTKSFRELKEDDWINLKRGFTCQQPTTYINTGVNWRTVKQTDVVNLSLIKFLSDYKICESQNKSKQLLNSNALAINNVKISSFYSAKTLTEIFNEYEITLRDNIFIIKIGKRRQVLIRIV